MTRSQFGRFRPVSSIAEQLHSGFATLHPQPPHERSSVPDGRDFQYVHAGLGPNPQPRRIPFRSTTVPDDTWNRLWAQSVKRHTGVVLPPLSRSKRPRMPPQKMPSAARPNKSRWEKHLSLYYNGEQHQTAQQYTADIRERARKDVADLHKEGLRQRKEIEIKDRRRKNWEHEEEVKKLMETHINLISSMESTSASIQTVEAESQSVVFALREKDNDLRTLNGKIEDLEIEVEILQEYYKKIDEYTGLLELVPPELWETVMRNLKDIQIKAKGFELLLETDLEYTELCLHEERGKMLLLKSIQDKMASLAMQKKIIFRNIVTRMEIIERLKLEVCIISKQKEEQNKRLKKFKGELEILRDSLKALKKRDMDLVKTITASCPC